MLAGSLRVRKSAREEGWLFKRNSVCLEKKEYVDYPGTLRFGDFSLRGL
jgi:hypothetical protein